MGRLRLEAANAHLPEQKRVLIGAQLFALRAVSAEMAALGVDTQQNGPAAGGCRL
jgi:hypothetical protein